MFVLEQARHGDSRAGPWPVQLRYACEDTGEEYLKFELGAEAPAPS